MEKRPFPPASTAAPAPRRGSEYSMQLAEKQKARFTYGLGERQFRNIYLEASRRDGVTGSTCCRYLELRLDNIVYRAAGPPPVRRRASSSATATSRSTASGSTSPAIRVARATSSSLRPEGRESVLVRWNMDVLDRSAAPGGSTSPRKAIRSRSATCRCASTSTSPVREQMIVELYSK
jgi:small subunit ribosomal protein S4